MMARLNDLDLPIGEVVERWQARERPPHTTLAGR